MERCKTCKFWEPETSSVIPRTHQMCVNPKLGEAGSVDSKLTGSLVYPYDEGGTIYTGPEFGCIHHRRDDA